MKKFLIAIIIGILVLSGLGAGAVQSNNLKPVSEITVYQEPQVSLVPRDFTHTIFAEYGTATWCGYCRYAHGALKEIYAEGQYPFYYVSLVDDKNPISAARNDEYNLYGFPTVWFDGGYKVNVGAGSIPSAKAGYISSINQCGSRVVEDIDIDLGVTWLGGTNMEIDVEVTNNEASTYGGRIRVYITEIVSSRGWYDTGGQLYTFPLLDYAFNEVLSINAGGSWTDTTTWDGTAHGFPTITETNIMVIAAVFNDEPHQGYSYPPSGYPFTAYYVDEAVGATPGAQNNPPDKPTIGGPKEGKANTPIEFSFKSIDPDGDNIAEYIINWGDGSGDETVSGPYSSGATVKVSHTWTTNGNYIITAKAKDVNDATGPSGIKSLSIPRPRSSFSPFYKFLESHPHIYMILKLLFNQF